jgi:predicted membrane chloride channel (bestrophin family)
MLFFSLLLNLQEGRKIWENILSNSRNLSRMVQLYSKEVGPERKQRILNLVAAYPYLLRHHIRPGCLCEDNPSNIAETDKLLLHEPSLVPIDARYEGDKLSGGVTEFDTALSSKPRSCFVDRRKLPWNLFEKKPLTSIARAKNRPLWVCDRLGREMMSIPYEPNFTSRERLTLLSKVEKLTDAVGQCERIHQTAVPLNYARHSLRSLTLWLFTLPFALVKDLGLLTAPVTACIAWLLFGVYQIGYSIEDPFQGSLRLSILCDAIRRDVLGKKSGGDAEDDGHDERWADNDRIEPLLLDESLLNAPKLLQGLNGTWNVVGV